MRMSRSRRERCSAAGNAWAMFRVVVATLQQPYRQDMESLRSPHTGVLNETGLLERFDLSRAKSPISDEAQDLIRPGKERT